MLVNNIMKNIFNHYIFDITMYTLPSQNSVWINIKYSFVWDIFVI